jgi:hypothetical protein
MVVRHKSGIYVRYCEILAEKEILTKGTEVKAGEARGTQAHRDANALTTSAARRSCMAFSISRQRDYRRATITAATVLSICRPHAAYAGRRH